MAVIVQARLAGFDESLEEAALDLGARPATVFSRITLPLIAPALLSGWLLSFTLSWDDVVISQFVAGPGSSTLPMVIFSKVRLGVSPDVNALATLMVSLVAVGVVVSTLLPADVASAAWRARCAWRKPPRSAGMVETILLGLDVGGSSIKAGAGGYRTRRSHHAAAFGAHADAVDTGSGAAGVRTHRW